MTLRDRCKAFADTVVCPTEMEDDLEAFVVTEIGRASSEKFDDAVPLALYFGTVADREEFVALIVAAKPGMITKRWPR